MKYKVNDECIGCGMCEATCPEVFSLTDEGVAKAIEDEVPADAEASAGASAGPSQRHLAVYQQNPDADSQLSARL